MRFLYQFALLPMIVGLSTVGVVQADEALFNHVVAGIDEARQRLQSGVFRASGRWTVNPSGDGKGFDGDVDIFCAFDYERDLLRYDERGPLRWGRPGPAPASYEYTKYVRTPEKVIRWDTYYKDQVQIHPHERKPSTAGGPFDVRVVGLETLGTLRTGTDFLKVRDYYLTIGERDGVKESPEVYRLSLAPDRKADVRATLWVNGQRGFSPIRYEVRVAKWAEPQATCEATWVEQSAVWVPRTFVGQTRHGEKISETLQLVFDWEAVNLPVADDLFGLKGLELEPTVQVVDRRLSEPVNLGTIEELIGPREQAPTGSGWFGLVVWFTLGAVFLVVLVGIVLLRGRRTAG